MQQLNGIDTFFAHHERPRAPMHIGAMLVYQRTNNPTHIDGLFGEIRQLFADRLPLSPIFRRKLVELPYQMDRPCWIEDADFQLDRHLHQEPPCTGDRDELLARIAALHAEPLDMGQPLWKVHLIDGLGPKQGYPRNSFALYVKVHHAAMDGVSGANILAAVNGRTPGGFDPVTDHWQPEISPQPLELAKRYWRRSVEKPVRFVAQASHVIPRLRKLKQTRLDPSHQPDINWQRSPFSGRICHQRQISRVSFNMDEIRALRRVLPSTTVNHVILCIVGGALRQYLIETDQLGSEPLNALIPMNVRNKDDAAAGNAISLMLASTRSDIADPLQRLQAVRDAAKSARASSEILGKRSLGELIDNVPVGVEKLLLSTLSALAHWPGGVPSPIHTIVSNVPGPPVPMYLNHHRLVDMMGLGILMDHIGLFHVANNYEKTMSISALSSPRSLTEPKRYERCLQQSYDELKRAALPPGS
ncbi:MAG: wax ester/triacylglycerol synthase family O-acyltransferase [Spongiibacter sp.]|nr:wax ester/triacylglycerol synthase family O-acyltransferase [Spongiibacter sp.]